ncbi:phosphotransferase [Actinomadura barringtoniae]|uniref:Phosphotransferase n=1 Tax=Actinomadura barringtoniae TaxID=1427535 RepID=A0A939PF11_9ACTN|nr:phosphotransferase [Actinomadura barringtoniae]MBO2451647.1 phosphotransferase [Actinomadura barringtoniae]
MTRSDWDELPATVRDAITQHTGTICCIKPAAVGNHADIASAIIGDDRRKVFVKAARKLPEKDGPEVVSLRTEAEVNPFVREFTPRLLWTEEVGGWLVLAFEYVTGRHPSYSPDSPDLELVAATVNRLQKTPRPDVVQRPVTNRWALPGEDVSPMAGEALLHTDLNASNILVTPDESVYIVDWAFVSRGAPWVELAQMIPWMLDAGHTPESVESWLGQFPAWTQTDSGSIDHYARLHTAVWERRKGLFPDQKWIPPYLELVKRWANYRGVLE